MYHNATPSRSRLKVWNESGTNRARIGDSSPCLLRSPQHIAQIAIFGTRSSLTRADKRWFGGEILKRFGWSESNQKRGRVKERVEARGALSHPLPLWGSEASEARSRGWGEGFSPRIETPHPALRATFSHKGRRDSTASASIRLRHALLSRTLSPCGRGLG